MKLILHQATLAITEIDFVPQHLDEVLKSCAVGSRMSDNDAFRRA